MNIFTKENREQLRQFIKLALISGIIFISILIIAFSTIIWMYRDKIIDRFIGQINQNLQTELFIDKISVNIFRSFPHASISLRNAIMMEAVQGTRDTLLKANRIDLQFSLIDLLKGDYTIKQAEVKGGFMFMKILADGSDNFTFWKSDGDSSESAEFEFNIRKIVFTQMDYKFKDYKDLHYVSVSIDKAIAGGNFTRDNYLLNLKGEMNINDLVVDNAFMIGNQRMSFDFFCDVINNNIIQFRQGKFNLGSHIFEAQGKIDVSGKNVTVDLQIDARQIKLENLIADLPPQYAKYFEGFRSKGELYFNALIQGAFTSSDMPYIKADFGIAKGEMIQRKANLKLENISFAGSFNNGSRKQMSTSTLIINDFSGNLNKSSVSGHAHIYNFDQPDLNIKLFSDINANEWYRFLQIATISEASGELLIDIDFKGKLTSVDKFTAYDFMASKIKGIIKGRDLSFRFTADPLIYHSVNGDFEFNNNDIIIQSFSGRASGSDFIMKGYFRNVLPWMFFENERLFVKASFISENLNFNELLQHSISGGDTTYRLRLSENIDFRLDAEIGKLAFKKFYGENLKGKLSMSQQIFQASDFSLSTMKGRIMASGYINGKNSNRLELGCETRFIDVDVYDLFYQMGNFGQESIEYHNLRGRITAEARFTSHWTPFLDIDWNALDVTADIRIENGELINYTPMLALSRFIRVGDLNQVKFSTLENQIRIKNQKLIIPDMEIKSNAINIHLSGEHTFDNEIDYRVKVLLSDLFARRHRESRNPQEKYGDIVDDGLGRTTLYLRVTGTIDNPVFRYDTRAVRDKIQADLRNERQNLRQVFRSEFGLGRNDTLPDGSFVKPPGERQIEKTEIEKREKGRFIIEWDD
jgi:uncharacterized protein YuzE